MMNIACHAVYNRRVVNIHQHFVNQVNYSLHMRFVHAAGSDGWYPYTDTRSNKRRFVIKRHGVNVNNHRICSNCLCKCTPPCIFPGILYIRNKGELSFLIAEHNIGMVQQKTEQGP